MRDMKFELSEDDIAYIMEDYEVDRDLVEDVIYQINESGIVASEDDFRDLVVESVSYYVSSLDEVERKRSEGETNLEEVTLNGVVNYQLNRYKKANGYKR